MMKLYLYGFGLKLGSLPTLRSQCYSCDFTFLNVLQSCSYVEGIRLFLADVLSLFLQ